MLNFKWQKHLYVYQNNSNNICLLIPLVSVRKRSCGKVMFSQACVKNSVHTGERCTPPADTCPGQTPLCQADTPWADSPPEMATATDSTHPTAMYSCYHLQCSCSKVMFSLFTVILFTGGVSQHALGETTRPAASRHSLDRHSTGQTPPLGRYPPGIHPPPLGRYPQADTPWTDTPWADIPHPSTATAADGTYPAGMHSCYN